MLKKTFVLLLLFRFQASYGQQGYMIIYERENLKGPAHYPSNAKLVFNDTLSFFYHLGFSVIDNYYKTRSVFGKYTGGHSWYYQPAKNFIAEGNTAGLTGKQTLIFDTSKKFNWVKVKNRTVRILGYDCAVAFSVNESNDSTFAYYTEQISYPYGPAWYNGLPGVILEVYDQKKGWSLSAIKIEKGSFAAELPHKYRLISRKKYNKKLQ